MHTNSEKEHDLETTTTKLKDSQIELTKFKMQLQELEEKRLKEVESSVKDQKRHSSWKFKCTSYQKRKGTGDFDFGKRGTICRCSKEKLRRC